MELVIKVQDKSGHIYDYQSFDDKEMFLTSVSKTYQRRERFNNLGNPDKVLDIFAKGCTIKSQDFDILARALRHYDEVYLCNEIYDAMEELPSDIVFLSIGEIKTPTDISGYEM